MDKLRKIGIGVWEAKERVVLALMVLLLGLRVYMLVNAEASEDAVSYRDPGSPQGIIADDAPPRPKDPLQAEPVNQLLRRAPFDYVQPSSRANAATAEDDRDSDVRVIRIVDVGNDRYRATITTGGKKTTVAEGDKFESYQLISIDPDTECCIIYSENSNSEIERCVE